MLTPPRRGAKVGGGVSDINQGFAASLFHPDHGNEVVNGLIFIDHWKVRFQSDWANEEIPIGEVEVEIEENGDRIYFNNPARPELRLFTLDQSILNHPVLRQSDEVRAQAQNVMSARETKRALKLTAYFIVFCVVATWLITVSLGFMTRVVVARIPMSWEEKYGKEQIDKILKGEDMVTNVAELEQLKTLAQPLIQVLPEDRRDLKFYIIKDGEPNAFAMPGGHVVVHTGLLEMVDTPEELLGVLAHEIAHETQRHLLRERIAAAGPFVIFGVFMSGHSGSASLMAAGSDVLIRQGYSQQYEAEADSVGWDYLVKANINPRGMIRTFQKFKTMEDKYKMNGVKLPQSLASHPALGTRILTLEKKWAKLDHQSGFLELPAVTWPKETADGEPDFFSHKRH